MSIQPPAWHFYRWTSDAWAGMLDALESAEKSIDFEQYFFVDLAEGRIGHRFVEVLERKAKAGVKVRLLLDGARCWEFYTSSVLSQLRNAGVHVLFHQVIPHKEITRFIQRFLRDHRRMLIVDSRVGFIGGVSISEKAAKWRESHLRFEGPVMENFQKEFECVWNNVEGKGKLLVTHPATSRDKFTVLPNGIRSSQRFILHFIHDAIRESKKCIYITTPYFAPSHGLFRSLRLAAQRGVDVRILLPYKSDHTTADVVGESFFSGAFRSGIKIYLYTPAFLHAKTVVVDDDWATIGTCNFDQLSFNLNYEINLVSYDPKFAFELKNHFFDDLQSSFEVLPEEWKRRSFFRKIIEKISIVIRPFV